MVLLTCSRRSCSNNPSLVSLQFFFPKEKQEFTQLLKKHPICDIAAKCKSQRWEARGSPSFTRPCKTTIVSRRKPSTPRPSLVPVLSQKSPSPSQMARLSQSIAIQSMWSHSSHSIKSSVNNARMLTSRNSSAHMVPGQRSNFRTMGRKTKSWIKGMRVVQLLLRACELVGAVGLLVLMILMTNVDALTGWVVRITVRHTHPAVSTMD